MKGWLLLLGLTFLVIALVTLREGFSATSTIKNPTTWDTAELSRIRTMVTPASTIPDADIRRVVGGFWGAWEAATNRITLADVNTYLDGLQDLGGNRNVYRDLLQAYYIDQGQSVFQTASGYSGLDTAAATPAPEMPTTTSTEIERPSTSTQSLRQEIATTAGVPENNDALITPFVTQVQRFYDTVYLPDKKTPTYTQITGFADGVDTSTLPATIQNNFKVRLITILQSYFTPTTGTSVSPVSGGGLTPGAADVSAASGEAEQGTWSLGTGQTVQGPASGGRGSAVENTTGGLAIPRNYPVLYGGMQEYAGAMPTSASLGTDPTSKFLPFSRVPGDQDLYPDPYRLGKYFSSSTYSAKDTSEPAPFLADFSKFLQ